MFTISGIIVAFSCLVSAIKILLNPSVFFFSVAPVAEPLSSEEESKFDLMEYNPITDKYEIKR